MKRFALLLILLMAAMPLAAQERDLAISGWVSRASLDGQDDFAEDFGTEFEERTGYGMSVDWGFSRMFALEGSVFFLRANADLILDDGVTLVDIGTVNLRPVSAGIQFRPLQSRIFPYLGAGATYMVTGDLVSGELTTGGQGTIEMENGVTYYGNVGIGIRLLEGLSIVADGRYIPFETDTTSTTTGVTQEMDLTSTIYSVGLRLKF